MGLLDDAYNPNADYFTGLLFNRLMSHKALGATTNDTNLRVYAHCARGASGEARNVSLAYINLNTESVKPEFDSNVLGSQVFIYSLTPGDGLAGLESETMSLNGEVLKLDNGKLPALNGMPVFDDTVIHSTFRASEWLRVL